MSLRTRRSAWLVAGCLLVSALASAQTKRAMSFVDAIDLPSLQDPQLSPDGKQILFVLDRSDWKNNRRAGPHLPDQRRRHRPDAADVRRARRDRARAGRPTARRSPSRRAATATPTTRSTCSTPRGGEARRVTNHPAAPGNLTWAPDGKTIYFTASDAKSAEEKRRIASRTTSTRSTRPTSSSATCGRRTSTGKTKKITDGDFSVSGYELSADGRRVAMTRTTSPLLEFTATTEVWVMDAGGRQREAADDNHIPESNAALSPDGSTVLFTADANEQFDIYYNDKLFLVPAAGGAARVLLPDVSYQVENAVWSKDGKSIFFTANMGIHNEVMRVDVASKQVTQLTKGEHAIGGLVGVGRSGPAGVHRATRRSGRARSTRWPLAGGEPRRVTSVFDDVVAKFKIARQERFTWKGQDGQAGRGHPLLPHRLPGRPEVPADRLHARRSGGVGSIRIQQRRAGATPAMGYAVLKPNYRGSTGYGNAFLRDMVERLLQAGAPRRDDGHRCRDRDRGWPIPNDSSKMGWSAGGHMTNKIITVHRSLQGREQRARAPRTGSRCTRRATPASLPHAVVRRHAVAERTRRSIVYWNNSPLKDVAKVKTPTIFLVGEQDRAGTDAAVGGDVSRAASQRRADASLRGAARAARMVGTAPSAVQVPDRDGVVREVRERRTYTWEKAPGDEERACQRRRTTAQP